MREYITLGSLLTFRQYKILKALNNTGYVSGSLRESGATHTHSVRITNEFVRTGLVTKARVDNRKIGVTLTDKGKKVLSLYEELEIILKS